MKKSALTFIGLSLVGTQAFASFETDLNKKMTDLLSHSPQVMNVFESQKQNLDHGRAAHQPWSGSFWPDIVGNVADHYRDHTKFNSQLTFAMNYSMGRRQFRGDHSSVEANFSEWDEDKLNDKLSPAEKYDLLLGDANFTFSNAVMDEIDFRVRHRLMTVLPNGTQVDESSLYDGDGRVVTSELEGDISDKNPRIFKWVNNGRTLAYWSGICDGWSPASLYLPRPVKPVTVTGALGNKITFYPDDLKALGSYLFARTNTPYFSTMNYKYAGQRCNEKGKPDRERDGRPTDMRCNDLDAGVWHTTLINRIGKDRMGFIMDYDNNVKVNNHPVYSYDLKYFNPVTGKEGSLKSSMVSKDDLPFDGYADRRNPKTVYLVGVKSHIQYMYYIWAEERRDATTDSPSADKMKDIEYTYDLELDANGNILGGEWGDRSQDRIRRGKVVYVEQPDFIWMAAPSALPYSEMSPYAMPGVKKDVSNARPFDNMSWNYDGKTLPADWLAAAKKDAEWQEPIVDDGTNTEAALGSPLKAAQPLSHIIYYLFDQARSKNQN